MYVVNANHTSNYVYERGMASCPGTDFSVVIIIRRPGRVSNIYTKQAIQNTEDYFINQFSCIVYLMFFMMQGLFCIKNIYNSMVYRLMAAWL